jgi:hypothetical protein
METELTWYQIPIVIALIFFGGWLHSKAPNYRGRNNKRKK